MNRNMHYGIRCRILSLLSFSLGRFPNIIEAFCLEPFGKLRGLETVKLRGAVAVDPNHEDFFKKAIEERKTATSLPNTAEYEAKRLDKSLKCTSNSTGFGIYAQMDRRESDEKMNIKCNGRHPKAYN